MKYIAMAAAFLVWASLAITAVAGWVTHVIICIKTSSWILLLFGCLVAPVGVIHGIGTWFGLF